MLNSRLSDYTTQELGAVLKEFNTSLASGLTEEEAQTRLNKYGANELKRKKTTWQPILVRQFRSPFIYLLLGASLLTFFLHEYLDSVMILIFVVINTGLGFIQEYHSEKTVALLQNYTDRRSRRLRNGKELLASSKELVPGDVVLLRAGDIVPADCRVADGSLLVDESILSGEAEPVNKDYREMANPAEQVYQAKNLVFSGTSILGGKAKAIILATGLNTNLGKIAQLSAQTDRVSTFEKEISRISSLILRLIFLTLAVVLVMNLFLKGEKADLASLIIFSIALAVSVIPEALPMVTTFSLSRGALRLAKKKVVVKRLSAIEDLGGLEILCTDKTGTLTENRLTVTDIFSSEPDKTRQYAFLARDQNDPATDPFSQPVEQQLTQLDRKAVSKITIVDEVPFSPERRRNAVVAKDGQKMWLIVRGAPEEIMDLCRNLNQVDKKEQWIKEQGLKGRRLICLAVKKLNTANQSSWTREKDLEFLGLISFADPLKQSTSEALAKAKQLGIKVKILTGDKEEVAGTVAYQVGLIGSVTEVMSGKNFELLSEQEKEQAVETVAVFARVSPEQKYQIIARLQKNHEVGFLGEGINDAPALKIANVGLVVQHASDIAREAADIVLLKRSLNVIVDGIQEGRKIFANTNKYIKVTLASNFGNFYAVALISLLIDFLPMLPLQILLLNLLSDFPMIAIATDSVDPEDLTTPKTGYVRGIALMATLLGLVSTVFDFILFGIFFRFSQAGLQTYWFIGSILTELVIIYSLRTKRPFFRGQRPSLPLVILSGLAALTTVVLPFTGFGQTVFRFIRPEPVWLGVILMIVGIYLLVTDQAKRLYYRYLGS
jgi:Mg2+-importing ATPase